MRINKKAATSSVSKAASENFGNDLETRPGPAMEQVATDNKPIATVIPPQDAVPQPTVTERLPTAEAVSLATSNSDTTHEADGPVPPLTQAANTRKALDDAMKGKIIELLSQPGANATTVSNATGVSYNQVLNIKQGLAKPKTNKPTRAVSIAPKAVQKPVAQPIGVGGPVEDVEMLKLELEFLRKKVALLEARAAK